MSCSTCGGKRVVLHMIPRPGGPPGNQEGPCPDCTCPTCKGTQSVPIAEDDECPNCKSGTLGLEEGMLTCRGECGASFYLGKGPCTTCSCLVCWEKPCQCCGICKGPCQGH
jgi:hypothetical protein